MKVNYDRSIQLGGIGVAPWPRLGPQLWFSDYKIASYYDWDINLDTAPEVRALMSYKPQTLPQLNTKQLLNNRDFQQILEKDFADRSILTYKPTSFVIPPILKEAKLQFLASKAVKFYENKLLFRQHFKDKLPLPKFAIIGPEEEPGLHDLLGGKDVIVLQDELLSGGKGTFIIRNAHELKTALKILRKSRHHIIASQFIENARERSLQCCVTRFGIFVGPLQKQLVRREELVNPLNADKFCGAEISPSDMLYGVYDEMNRYCRVIGEELRSSGYRGIFGLDFLVSPQGLVYVLEVNQRITGVTPLLSMLYRPEQDIPFYLLHILEQGNFDYSIDDPEINQHPQAGSLLIFHSLNSKKTTIERTIDSGFYDPTSYDFKSQGFWPRQSSKEILLQQQVPPGTVVKAGAKLITAFIPGEVLNQRDDFTDRAIQTVENIYGKLRLSNID